MRKNFGTKIARGVLCAGVCALAIGGGSMLASYASTTETTAQEARMENPPENDGSVMAKITAVDDDTLTVLLSEQKGHGAGRQEDGSQPAEGETPPENLEGKSQPAEGETPPAKPEGESQLAEGETPPERPEVESDQTNERQMEFNGETATLTLTDDTVITKGMDKETASVSDLAADSVVRMVLDGTTVVSIDIMQ